MMIGRRLKLDIFGESHAPSIGMRLKGLPREEKIDWAAVQRFVDRRSAGRNRYSTARHEPDVVEIDATRFPLTDVLDDSSGRYRFFRVVVE